MVNSIVCDARSQVAPIFRIVEDGIKKTHIIPIL